MTPEKEIVEAAVAWRKVWLDITSADKKKPKGANEYRVASAAIRVKLDEATALKDKLFDLLDQYIVAPSDIGENP